MTSIGDYAFSSCSGLTSITVSTGNPKYDSRNNCNAIIETSSNTLITGCKNTLIPNSVTSIGNYAFYGCSGLTSITIPNSVTSIGNAAFRECSGLTTITIPNSVTSIGSNPFSYCSGVTSITVSSGNSKYDSRNNCNAIIETSSNSLIAGCKNTTIPNNVTSIVGSAFSGCSGLTSITIPNSVTSIGNYAFRSCGGLTSVTIGDNVTSIGGSAFSGCSGLTSIMIPNSVTSIGDYAFEYCSGLTSVTIPNSLTSIGQYAFSGCSGLTSFVSEIQDPFEIKENVFSSDTYSTATLTVPAGTKSKYQSTNYWNKFTNIVESTNDSQIISFADANVKAICVANWDTNGDGELSEQEAAAVKDIGTVFNGNTTIKSFDEFLFFTGLETTPNSAFYNCSSLTSITIPNSVTSIGGFAFSGCSGLTSITIPNGVTSIGNQSFFGCRGLTSITIPNSVTSIGDAAFADCSGLTSITVSSGNTKYDSRNNCNAIIETSSNTLITGCKNTIIPNSVTSIGKSAFYYCSGLTSITIPNSVTSIGDYAFYYCSGLTSITIPNSVTSIGERAFISCSGLISITVSNGNNKYDSRNNCNAIIETSSNTLMSGCKNTIIPNSVTSIGDYAFYYCSGLTSITIPNSVTNIGNSAFHGCSGLNSITIPNSVTSIGNSAFERCSGLTSITIPNSVTSIGALAFSGCSGLISITIPNSVTSIGNSAFYKCNGLTSITIGNSVTSIGSQAFWGCNSLTSITIPNSVTSIGGSAFNGCKSLTSITIPNSVTSIGGSAFVLCSKLQKVKSDIINPYNISSSVFSGISSDAILYVPTGTKEKYQAYEGWTKYFKEIIEYSTETTTYSLSITASGDGYASYNGITIRNNTQSFTVNESANAAVSFIPDNGYRIASVKLNNTDVTSSVSNNRYTISNISANTTLEVEFEAIPATTYTLSIKATGNGYVSYNGTTTRNETNSFTVNEGTNATITFSPDNGYRLAGVRVNNSDVTNSVYNNQYTINNIRANTTLSVEFEAIPVTTYSLSISASGNGYVSYNGSAIRNRTTSFTLDEGTSATVIFAPDNGNSIASVKLNNSDITSQISGNSYTISDITANTTLSVTFQEDLNALTVDGLNYTVTSQSNKTVLLTSGGTGLVLMVPATITQNGTTWKVTGIDKDALKGNTELSAIIWNPEAAFTATVSNPNLLLYVKSSDYAPASIQNVVVNGTASNIVLAEAKSGNNFYCPQTFVAQKISFTHNYQMQTGIGESRGWETIALPFDVQTITHATKGTS